MKLFAKILWMNWIVNQSLILEKIVAYSSFISWVIARRKDILTSAPGSDMRTVWTNIGDARGRTNGRTKHFEEVALHNYVESVFNCWKNGMVEFSWYTRLIFKHKIYIWLYFDKKLTYLPFKVSPLSRPLIQSSPFIWINNKSPKTKSILSHSLIPRLLKDQIIQVSKNMND